MIPSVAGRPWWAANELLAFLLEVAALACLFWWGFALADNLALQLLTGTAVLAAAVVLWGLFAAPRARFRPPLAGVLAVKALVLGGEPSRCTGSGTRSPLRCWVPSSWSIRPWRKPSGAASRPPPDRGLGARAGFRRA